MSKKALLVGLYVLLLAVGIIICRGRTIPLYAAHSQARRAIEILRPSAHTVHSPAPPHKRSRSSRRQVA